MDPEELQNGFAAGYAGMRGGFGAPPGAGMPPRDQFAQDQSLPQPPAQGPQNPFAAQMAPEPSMQAQQQPGMSNWAPVNRGGQQPALGQSQPVQPLQQPLPQSSLNPSLFAPLDPRQQMQIDELEMARDLVMRDPSGNASQKFAALHQINSRLQTIDPEGNYSRAAGSLRSTIPQVTREVANRMQVFPEHGFAVAVQPDGKMLFHKLEASKNEQRQPWSVEDLQKHVIVDPRSGHSYIQQPDGKITHIPAQKQEGGKAEELQAKHEEKLAKEYDDAYKLLHVKGAIDQPDKPPKHEDVQEYLEKKKNYIRGVKIPEPPKIPGPEKPLGKKQVIDTVREDKKANRHPEWYSDQQRQAADTMDQQQFRPGRLPPGPADRWHQPPQFTGQQTPPGF